MTPTLNYLTVFTAIMSATVVTQHWPDYAFVAACIGGATWGIVSAFNRHR